VLLSDTGTGGYVGARACEKGEEEGMGGERVARQTLGETSVVMKFRGPSVLVGLKRERGDPGKRGEANRRRRVGVFKIYKRSERSSR